MWEVSDSLHLRRFCRIALCERVPDESTIRKLTRRLGREVIDEITRWVIARELRERRLVARALRVDSPVVEADVRYPNDTALVVDATRVLARAARRVIGLAGPGARGVGDRSRSAARVLRHSARTLARRTGQARREVLKLAGRAGALVKQSVRETRWLASRLPERARGGGARARQAAARRLAERAETIARQIDRRLAEEPISDRLVSMFDPDARPIGKGKLRAPTEFGYVFRFAELSEHTGRGARGLLVPAATRSGNPGEDAPLASTAEQLARLGVLPREVALDGGFNPGPTASALPASQRVFISARQSTGSRRSDRRLANYRVGCEGRISHLKRRYGTRRSRLKGHTGARTTVGGSVPAYNLDTPAIRTA